MSTQLHSILHASGTPELREHEGKGKKVAHHSRNLLVLSRVALLLTYLPFCLLVVNYLHDQT